MTIRRLRENPNFSRYGTDTRFGMDQGNELLNSRVWNYRGSPPPDRLKLHDGPLADRIVGTLTQNWKTNINVARTWGCAVLETATRLGHSLEQLWDDNALIQVLRATPGLGPPEAVSAGG
jgi:hypothetical protein